MSNTNSYNFDKNRDRDTNEWAKCFNCGKVLPGHYNVLVNDNIWCGHCDPEEVKREMIMDKNK